MVLSDGYFLLCDWDTVGTVSMSKLFLSCAESGRDCHIIELLRFHPVHGVSTGAGAPGAADGHQPSGHLHRGSRRARKRRKVRLRLAR